MPGNVYKFIILNVLTLSWRVKYFYDQKTWYCLRIGTNSKDGINQVLIFLIFSSFDSQGFFCKIENLVKFLLG